MKWRRLVTQRRKKLGKSWRRYGTPTDLGQNPLVATLETALKGRQSANVQGRLGDHPFLARTRGNVVCIVILFDPTVVFCFEESRKQLKDILKLTSDGLLLRALYGMGQKAELRSSDLTEAEARKWIGV